MRTFQRIVVSSVVFAAPVASAGVTGNGALASLNNGASRDLTNGASVTYSNGASASYPNGASVTLGNGASLGLGNGASLGLGNGANTSLSNGASVTYGNGATIAFPNGASVTYPNGATVVYNGASTTYGNGASATYPNGAQITLPNGASIAYPNGANTTLPNGARLTLGNGATLTFPNGARVDLPNGASVTYPNGGTVYLAGFSTQAFLNSHLWRFPIDKNGFHPTLWTAGTGTSQDRLRQYLVGALQAKNGDLPAGAFYSDNNYSGPYDPYDLIAFRYLVRAAAKDTTVFTVGYTRANGQVVSEDFPGGLGLCETGAAADWISPVYDGAQHSMAASNCAAWITAAISVFTQPSGINNSISIRNIARGDHPALTSTDGSSLQYLFKSSAPALNLVSLIRPLSKKRGVAINPTATTDNRALEAMTMAAGGNSGTYSSTNNTQGGWAGGYAFRCTGSSSVNTVFSLNKLKTSTTAIPGTSVARNAVNLVVRICKGVHGCNRNDADWVADFDDASGTDVWPMATFQCGAGFAEVASADRTKYKFVYSWLVRAKDGNDAVSTGIANLCATAPESTCRATAANPTIATTDTAPAGEADIYTLREGLFFGNAITLGHYYAGSSVTLATPITTFTQTGTDATLGSLMANCDVRSVENRDFGFSAPEPNRTSFTAPSNMPWTSTLATWPASYRSLAHSAPTTDRNTYKKEYCLSLRQDVCIPCVQAYLGGADPAAYIPIAVATTSGNVYWSPRAYPYEPWIGVAKDAAYLEVAQYPREAVPVEHAYYNATRVCSQQYDRTNQGMCFADWQTSATCGLVNNSFSCWSKRYRDSNATALPAQGFALARQVLVVYLPQPVQPTTTANAGRCPVGFSLGTGTGMTARCFAPQAANASCQVNDECLSKSCVTNRCR